MSDEAIGRYREYAKRGKVVVFDTETTGVGTSDEVCQIAAVHFERGVRVQSMNEYLRISFPMPYYAESIHGISDEFLAEHGIEPSEGLNKFFEFVKGDALLVAHNAKFDIRMIGGTCAKNGIEGLPEDVFVCDTWHLAKKVVPGLENYQLATLIDEFHVDAVNSHDAMDDVLGCAGVFFHLVDMATRKGTRR